jgi:hypothetical protein
MNFLLVLVICLSMPFTVLRQAIVWGGYLTLVSQLN